MTVLEWLAATTMYSSFTEQNFIKIAADRGIDPYVDVYDESVVTKRERDLMTADLIFTAILLRPSNTASISESHAGYQSTVGQEQDFYQDDKIKYAISLYRVYNDERGEILEKATKRTIKFLHVDDVDTKGHLL